MKKLGIRKKETNLKRISVLEGYNIYIPECYNNPLGFLKEQCPIWIEYNKSDYMVLEITNSTTWKEETIQYIQKNFPRIEEPICRYLSPDDMSIGEEEKQIFIMELSGQIFDREGYIKSKIIALNRNIPDEIVEKFDDNIESLPTIELVVRNCRYPSSLKDLIVNILNRKNISKYKEYILWYKPNENVDFSNELGFSPTDYGVFICKIEL